MLKPKVYREKTSPHVYEEQLFEESNITKAWVEDILQYLEIERTTDKIDRFFSERGYLEIVWVICKTSMKCKTQVKIHSIIRVSHPLVFASL